MDPHLGRGLRNAPILSAALWAILSYVVVILLGVR